LEPSKPRKLTDDELAQIRALKADTDLGDLGRQIREHTERWLTDNVPPKDPDELPLFLPRPRHKDGRQFTNAEMELLYSESSPPKTEEARALLAGIDARYQKTRSAYLAARQNETNTRGAVGERNSRVIPQDVKIAVALRDQGRCVQCGSTEKLHFDHKIPWSRGGTNTVNNIQLLCGRCNRRKGVDDIPV
jgi:hypothetical protein